MWPHGIESHPHALDNIGHRVRDPVARLALGLERIVERELLVAGVRLLHGSEQPFLESEFGGFADRALRSMRDGNGDLGTTYVNVISVGAYAVLGGNQQVNERSESCTYDYIVVG